MGYFRLSCIAAEHLAWHSHTFADDIEFFHRETEDLTSPAVSAVATAGDITFFVHSLGYPDDDSDVVVGYDAKFAVAFPEQNRALILHYKKDDHEETLMTFLGNQTPRRL
jgi:hypothetical protein